MYLCAAGDIHGALDRLHEDVLRFELERGVRLDGVPQVGDFGAWPDPARPDRATRNHDGAGGFPQWLASGRAAPRPTVFIKGNHEDFEWLDAQQAPEVLPGLTHDARRLGFEGHRPGAGYVSAAAGLDSLLAGARPGVCFFGHHHTRLDADVAASAASGSTRWRAPATWWRSASSPGDASGW